MVIPCVSIYQDCFEVLLSQARSNSSSSAGDTTPPPDPTLLIDHIAPALICSSEIGVEVEVYPTAGNQFPVNAEGAAYKYAVMYANGGSMMSIDSIELETTVWTPDLIKFKTVAGMHTGRVYIKQTKVSTGGGRSKPKMSKFCQEFFARYFGVEIPSLDVPLPDIPTPAYLPEAYVDLTGNAILEIVQVPVIQWLTANGTEDLLLVEACQPVEIAWFIDFGMNWFYVADNYSLHRVSVDLQENGGSIYNTGSNDDAYVSHSSQDNLYQIIATSSANGNACGMDNADITVDRFFALHLEFATSPYIQAGGDIDLIVRRSCVSDVALDVSVSVSNPGLLNTAGTVTIPAGTNEVQFTADAAANGCGYVDITVDVPGYENDSLRVYVYDNPQITSLSPTSHRACDSFTATLHADCLFPVLVSNQVFLRGPTGDSALSVTDSSSGSLEFTVPSQNPGQYYIYVRHNGLDSNLVPLSIASASALINSFNVSPQEIPACINSDIGVTWSVSNAQEVRIRVGGSTIHTQTRNSCGSLSGSLTRTVSGNTDFRIEAVPLGGGSTISQTTTVEQETNYTLRDVTVRNLGDDYYIIWLVTATGAGAVWNYIGDIDSGENINVRANHCTIFNIRVVKLSNVPWELDPWSLYVAQGANYAWYLFASDQLGHNNGNSIIANLSY